MKVTDASTYRIMQTNLNHNARRLQELYQQGSTGLKLNTASDNPSAIQPVLSSRNQITLAERFLNTLGISADNMASTDTNLATIENIFQRASEIAVNAVNSSLNTKDLTTLADEVEELKAQMFDIANAQIDGKFIFAGYSVTHQPFEKNPGYDPTLYDEADSSTWPVLYRGDSNRSTLEIGENEYLDVNLTGNELFLGIENSEYQNGNSGLSGSTIISNGPLTPGGAGDIVIETPDNGTITIAQGQLIDTDDNYATKLAGFLENGPTGATDTGLRADINPASHDLGDMSSLASQGLGDTYNLAISSESATVTVSLVGPSTLQDMAAALEATGATDVTYDTSGNPVSGTLTNGVSFDISSGTLQFTGNENGADLELSDATSTTPIIGTSTNYGTVNITADTTDNVTISGAGLSNAGLSAGTLTGSVTIDMFGVLNRLEESLRAGNLDDPNGTGGGVQEAISKLDLAADQNRRKRSQLGVKAMRVDNAVAHLKGALIDIKSTLSRYEDADITQTYNDILQQETAWQSALSVTGRISQISILDYL